MESKQILEVQLPDKTTVLCGLVEFEQVPINSSTEEREPLFEKVEDEAKERAAE